MTDPIQTVREALKSDSVRFYTEDEALAALARVEAVVTTARELAVIEFDPHEGPPDPVVFWSRLTRLRAALDPTEAPHG